jgi:hypothetical protein
VDGGTMTQLNLTMLIAVAALIIAILALVLN